MAIAASAGFNVFIEYAKINPYGTAAACVVGSAILFAFASAGKCQKSATNVQKVIQAVTLVQRGTTCRLIGAQTATSEELQQKVTAMTTRVQISKLVLQFDNSLQFTAEEATKLLSSFPKLAIVSILSSAPQKVWFDMLAMPQFQHIKFEKMKTSA